MKTNVALWVAVSLSATGGCGLVKVNGKSLGSSSSSSPDSSSSSSSASNDATAPAQEAAASAEPAAAKKSSWPEFKIPAWCKGADKIGPADRGHVSDYDWKNFDEEDPRAVVRTVVSAYCSPNDYARRDAKILEAGFKKWTAKLDMIEADWADAVEFFAEGSIHPDPKIADEKMSWRKWSPIDQFLAFPKLRMGWVNTQVDEIYVADALDKQLTALGRLSYVATCIRSDAQAAWAICQAEFEAIDRKAIAAELRADKTHDGADKTKIRNQLLALYGQLDEHGKKVKQLKAKDPGWAKMFEVAAAARKDWAAKADPKLVELVMSMDDARVTKSRKATEGCREKTWAAFQTIVASIPAKTYGERKQWDVEEAMALVVDSPNGNLTSLALWYCAAYDEKMDYIARAVGRQLHSTAGYRGPRSAAYTAIRNAGIVLDDRDEKISYPSLIRPTPGTGTASGGGKGKVASVTVKGATAVIEFAKEKFSQQECSKGHYTHRVLSISSDGTIRYEYICEKFVTMTYSEAPSDPQTVKALYVSGIKKGMFVQTLDDAVVFAYAKESSSVPSVVAGVVVN